MDRYEKRARELVEETNQLIRQGRLIAGSDQYDERQWLIKKLFDASKTYKQR